MNGQSRKHIRTRPTSWWANKVALAETHLLAGEQTSSDDTVLEVVVLNAIRRYAESAKTPKEFQLRHYLAVHAAKLEPWSATEAGKRAGCSREYVSRSQPKILQSLAPLIAEELAARGRSLSSPRRGL